MSTEQRPKSASYYPGAAWMDRWVCMAVTATTRWNLSGIWRNTQRCLPETQCRG